MEFTDDCSFFDLFKKKEVLLESNCETSPPNKKTVLFWDVICLPGDFYMKERMGIEKENDN